MIKKFNDFDINEGFFSKIKEGPYKGNQKLGPYSERPNAVPAPQRRINYDDYNEVEPGVYKHRNNPNNMTPPTFYDDILTEEEKEFLSRWLKNCDNEWGFEPKDINLCESIFEKLNIK